MGFSTISNDICVAAQWAVLYSLIDITPSPKKEVSLKRTPLHHFIDDCETVDKYRVLKIKVLHLRPVGA